MRLGGRSPQQPGGGNPVRESMGCMNREERLRRQTRELQQLDDLIIVCGRHLQTRTETEVMELQREKAAKWNAWLTTLDEHIREQVMNV